MGKVEIRYVIHNDIFWWACVMPIITLSVSDFLLSVFVIMFVQRGTVLLHITQSHWDTQKALCLHRGQHLMCSSCWEWRQQAVNAVRLFMTVRSTSLYREQHTIIVWMFVLVFSVAVSSQAGQNETVESFSYQCVWVWLSGKNIYVPLWIVLSFVYSCSFYLFIHS